MGAVPSVNTNPGANSYATSGERIIEYSAKADPGDGSGLNLAGGLISLRVVDGRLVVHLYRHDPNVQITVSGQDRAPVADVWPSEPIFNPGDRVTYVQSLTRLPTDHGTIVSASLYRDEPDEAPYRVYTVKLRSGGDGYPWSEDRLIRGWYGAA